ncbi:uncharacterized protein LOC131621398 [Vicia villosa]|uniref:uncharacterized protein LOC131621398 n=1 Tax=Vicia villosa TaxID=3911 RepID=UPI00273C9D6E|nr:uncharacterized protein LOC131621398 [Vicia villosa]
MTKAEAQEMLITELGADPDDALEELERTRGAHAEGDELKQTTHRERALRCYFLYLIGTQLFVDMSSSYTDIVYLTYLSDIARIHEYNWGAAVLAYNYHKLGEGCMWKARTIAGSWLDTTTLPIHYWLGRGAYLHKDHAACQCFHPLRGNQVPDPYKRGLDRIAAEDIKYYCNAEHREMVPFDEIVLYPGWLAASSTIVVRYLPKRVMREIGYEQIPRDPTVSTPIAMTRRKLDEVFADLEHHMVPKEAWAMLEEHDWRCTEGYISWY